MLGSRYEMAVTMQVEEALALAEERSFELFLLDINLGAVHSGIELLGLLRALPQHRETPALAFTVYAMPGDRERFLASGFNGYISKPFTREGLVGAIDKLLLNGASR